MLLTGGGLTVIRFFNTGRKSPRCAACGSPRLHISTFGSR